MAGAFVLGFDSAIATSLNMFPQLGLGILKSVQDGNIKEAREYQNKLNKAVEIVTRNGNDRKGRNKSFMTECLILGDWVETMKEAMTILTPVDCGPPRKPLTQLTSAQVKQMAAELKAAAF